MGSHNPPPSGTQRPCRHSFPFPIDVGPPNPPHSRPSVLVGTPSHVHPLRGSASLLAHCPVSDFDTIYNGLSPPLTDIVLFRFSLSDFLSWFFKARLLRRGFHILKNGVSFSSPIDVGSHPAFLRKWFCSKFSFIYT